MTRSQLFLYKAIKTALKIKRPLNQLSNCELICYRKPAIAAEVTRNSISAKFIYHIIKH